MSLAIICCQSLEQEIKAISRDIQEVTHLEVMSWTLHNDPALLFETVIEKIEVLQDNVDAIMLGYGRCQVLDRLPNHFKVPIFRPEADDCIGVLLGQKQYEKERLKEPGTWYLTRGWIEICMELISKESQIIPTADKFAEKGIDPAVFMRSMLKYYNRGLFIHTSVGNQADLLNKVEKITDELDLDLEKTCGSNQLLEKTLRKALDYISQNGNSKISVSS